MITVFLTQFKNRSFITTYKFDLSMIRAISQELQVLDKNVDSRYYNRPLFNFEKDSLFTKVLKQVADKLYVSNKVYRKK